VGLVSHPAAVDRAGCPSADRLHSSPAVALAALFGPEHGFLGRTGAGVACRNARHPAWDIPVFSLYGSTRIPTPAMLRRVDAFVFDVQGLGARPYTYVSTLRNVLEAAAHAGKEVIVADRPVPLPRVVDGPVTDEAHRSFVAAIPAPLSYGMTPGETALWLKDELGLDVGLRVACMKGYARQPGRDADWPPWLPPSPAMLSWEAARCYPATVFAEGLVSVDHGRGTALAFRVFGARWLRGAETAQRLSALRLPGVRFHAHGYVPHGARRQLDGVRMTVINPHRFRPAVTAVSIVHELQAVYGKDRLWSVPKDRALFFDSLMGTSEVRRALLDGENVAAIVARWKKPLAAFRRQRRKHLLYACADHAKP